MTRKIDGYVVFDVVRNQGKVYRLWCGPPITTDNLNIILVHGAVLPFPGAYHDPTEMNNEKYCFYELDSLLYNNFRDNVFTFEYANEPIYTPVSHLFLGCVNYDSLFTYGEWLVEAIKVVHNTNQSGTINIVAHSFGGLVARYAAKKIAAEYAANKLSWTVNKIITLDTGHYGFGLANLVDKVLKSATGHDLPDSMHCSRDAEIRSDFINQLNTNVNLNNPKLVSLAAKDEMPLPPPLPSPPALSIRVVDFSSSSMGQVLDNKDCTCGSHNNPTFCCLPYNHASIPQIMDSSHQAYQAIRKFFHPESVKY
jgi:lipase (class 2)